MNLPSEIEFRQGVEAFEKRERRDAMYKVATFLTSHFWGHPRDMADGLGVLLLTWNNAFYRYGPFDFFALEEVIRTNMDVLDSFRSRDISSLNAGDEPVIREIFLKFLEALSIVDGSSKGRISPVSVGKTLHVLAPNFFPLWDARIARAYGCYYDFDPAGKYIAFCRLMKTLVRETDAYMPSTEKSRLKLIDQCNYSKYTQHWI